MPIKTLAGVETYYTESGQGACAVLMLHCYLTHSGMWQGVQNALGENAQRKLKTCAFDMPGHGRSGDWVFGGERDYQTTNLEIALALIDAPVDVIGHSFGATIALRLAQEYPDKVRSVTLIEPVLFNAVRDLPAYADHMDEMVRFEAAMKVADYTNAAREFDAVWGPGAGWENLPAPRQASLIKRIPLIAEGAGVSLEDKHRQTTPGALEAVKPPVLLLEGAKSPEIINAVHGALAARIPNVRRVSIKDAGHMLPITHPMQVAGEIADFLNI